MENGTGAAVIWASLILAFGLIVSAWLISTDDYERCFVLHGAPAAPSPIPTEAMQ